MKVNFLVNKVPWFGKYSGYETLPTYITAPGFDISVYNASEDGFIKKALGKYYQYTLGIKGVKNNHLANGLLYLRNLRENDINHVLYLENHLHLLNIANQKQLANTIGTIHLPISQWTEKKLAQLPKLKHAVALYEAELSKFQNYLNQDVKFIRHGVDNSFFKPTDAERDKSKILVVGHYLRNFEMLNRVVDILSKNSDLTFHLIIPSLYRDNKPLTELASRRNVFFYEKLSDQQLLEQYQQCGLMLMPMNDSGANTALVQGIACGIPIVTTDNGGVRSYGGGDVYPVVENNDDQAMVDAVEKLLNDADQFNRCSTQLRRFSTQYLDWNVVVGQHVEYYQVVSGGR